MFLQRWHFFKEVDFVDENADKHYDDLVGG